MSAFTSLGWQTSLAFAAAWQHRCAQRDDLRACRPVPLRRAPKTRSIIQGLWFPVDESRGARHQE
jgi:hypothetical protein